MSDDLEAYFSKFTYKPEPERGSMPVERRMFQIGSLAIKGNHLLFCDSWQTPQDGVKVEVPSGTYDICVEAQSYGTDGRIARFIVTLPGTAPRRGEEKGAFSVDVASAAVCDGDAMEHFVKEDEAAWTAWIESFIDGGREFPAGVFPCAAADTSMVYTRTGFGDGYYPVYELVEGSKVVGAEAVFLLPDQGYFSDDGPRVINGCA